MKSLHQYRLSRSQYITRIYGQLYLVHCDDRVMPKNAKYLLCPLTVIQIRLLSLPLPSFRRTILFIDLQTPYPFAVGYREDPSLEFTESLVRHFDRDQMSDVPSLVWHSGSDLANLFGCALRTTGSTRLDDGDQLTASGPIWHAYQKVKYSPGGLFRRPR